MGQYDGGNTVDSSGWVRPVSGKDGQTHPAPAPMEQTEDGMKRTVTPDPYANGGNGSTVRNFGRH